MKSSFCKMPAPPQVPRHKIRSTYWEITINGMWDEHRKTLKPFDAPWCYYAVYGCCQNTYGDDLELVVKTKNQMTLSAFAKKTLLRLDECKPVGRARAAFLLNWMARSKEIEGCAWIGEPPKAICNKGTPNKIEEVYVPPEGYVPAQPKYRECQGHTLSDGRTYKEGKCAKCMPWLAKVEAVAAREANKTEEPVTTQAQPAYEEVTVKTGDEPITVYVPVGEKVDL